MGPMGKMMPTYRATNALLTNSGCGAVLTVFCLPEVDPYFKHVSIISPVGPIPISLFVFELEAKE